MAKTPTQIAATLLEKVYGPISSPQFPLPLPTHEAGACMNGDRRYLWTDAFAVMCYTALAQNCSSDSSSSSASSSASDSSTDRKMYLRAASKLIDSVHQGLGQPRNSNADDNSACAMMKNTHAHSSSSSSSLFPFIGWRIGKEHYRKMSDAGMSYDGQYFHYTDKFLFALLRYGLVSGDNARIEQAAIQAKLLFPHFYDNVNHGIRWKINVNSSPILGCEDGRPHSGDTFNAYWIYSLINHHHHHVTFSTKQQQQQQTQETTATATTHSLDTVPENKYLLDEEVSKLSHALRIDSGKFQLPPVTSDPLGFGLEAWIDNWISVEKRRTSSLKRLSSSALSISHLSLPFRLYGALFGANINNNNNNNNTVKIAKQEHVNELIEFCTKFELEEGGEPEFSSINRVMLATAILAPSPVFSPFENEPQFC